jgi:hypothetical protein
MAVTPRVILSDDSIKVSLESKFDNKYKLVRNTGENIDDKHCFDTLALTKHLPLTSKQQGLSATKARSNHG